MNKIRCFLISGLFASTIVCNSVSWAGAHAELEEATPAIDSTISTMPQSISLTFGEELITLEGEKINSLKLTDPSDVNISLSAPIIEGSKISAEIEQFENGAFLPGKYEISYRVVSADGHPISGSIHFVLLASESSPSASSSAMETSEDKQTTSESQSSNGFDSIYLMAGIVFILVSGSIVIFKRK